MPDSKTILGPPSTFATYLRLLRYLVRFKWPFIISIIGFFIFASSQPLLAKLMGMVFSAIEDKNVDARWSLPFMAVGIFTIRGFGNFLGVYFNDFVGTSVVRALRKELFLHLTILPASFYDNEAQGNILQRLGQGVMNVQGAITGAIKTLIREGLTLIAVIGYVFYLNWKLSLFFILIAPFVVLIVSYTTKQLKSAAKKNEGALGMAMQVTKELISNYGVVRAFGAEKYERQRYNRAVDNAFKIQMKMRKVTALATPVMQIVVSIAVAGIIFMLLQPEILANSSSEDLVTYLTAAAFIPKPLRQLSEVNITIQRGVIGASMIFQLLDTKPEVESGNKTIKRASGNLVFKNINFSYPKSKSPALKNINLEINPGEMVAFVGKSGSGKSTLANLIMRLYDYNSGEIYIDDMPISQLTLFNLRQQISLVNQNVTLFDDTIKNNIAYGEIDYTDEQFNNAIQSAHADSFINEQPKGLETLIGDNGIKLSGGQRQRIAIARAFLKDAPLLIMDEATSALDNESEGVIKDSIDKITKGRTTIVIAHRLSTIEKADRVYVMDEGEIIESGTHKELLELNGPYQRLYAAGFKNA